MSLYNPQNIRMPTFQWDSICINAALTHFFAKERVSKSIDEQLQPHFLA